MTSARYRLAGYLMVAVAATGWGLWSLFFRPAEAIAPVHPALQALIVFSAQGLVTLPAGLRGLSKKRPASAWLAVAYLGIGDALNAALFFAAMQKSSLAVAVLSHYLAPVFVALAAPRVLGETPRRGTLLALGAALIGLLLLMQPWDSRTKSMWLGAALGAGSAVFYAINVLVTKRVQRHFSPRELLFFHVPTALFCLVLLLPSASYGIAPTALAWVFAGAVLLGALGGILFLTGLERVDATRASVLTLLEPVSAVCVGALVWGEKLDWISGLGALIVLLSLGRVLARAAVPPGAASGDARS
jgi:drug/metabolite transporter (DMT)-like permease